MKMIKFHHGDEVIDFDLTVLWNDEAILLEKVTGRRLVELSQAFDDGEMEARTAYFWLARRREYGPEKAGLLSEFRFNVAEFSLELLTGDTGAAPDPSTAATTDESAANTSEPPASPRSNASSTATSAPRRSTATSARGSSKSSPPKSGKR